MAEFRIVVVVDSSRAARGVGQVERQLNRASTSADRLRASLARAFVGIGAGLAVRQLVQMADSLTNLQNRLRLVTGSTQELASVTSQLFDIANRTRSSYEGTADLFARVSQATRELGRTQEEVLSFTESLNKAIILSGASAQEAQAGLIQLAQGLASGALRGDELRSVLEQLPAVADVIARSLGVTRGQLRDLGADGKITADIIIDAFANAKDVLDNQFGTTVATVGQAMTVLKNRFLEFYQAILQSTNASAGLANAILAFSNVFTYLTENINTVISLLQTLAIVIGTYLAAQAIPLAIGAFQALFAVMLANPITALLLALTAAIAAVISFSDQLRAAGGSFAELANSVRAFGSIISQGLQNAFSTLQQMIPALNQFDGAWEAMAAGAVAAIEGIINALDFLIAAQDAAVAAILAVWNNFPAAFVEIATRAVQGAVAAVQAGVNAIIGLLNSIPGMNGSIGTVDLSGFVPDVTGATGTPVQDALVGTFEAQRGKLVEHFNQVRQNIEVTSQLRGSMDELTTSTSTQIPVMEGAAAALGGAGDAAKKAGGGAGGAASSMDQLKSSVDSLVQSVSPLAAAEQRLTEAQTTLDAAVAAGIITADRASEVYRRIYRDVIGVGNAETDLAEKQQLLNQALSEGVISSEEFGKAMRDLEGQVSGSSNFISSALETTFNAASSALADFVRTGKFDFAEFTRSLLADLTQLAANQLFQQLLSGSFGGGGGGGLFGGLFGGGGGGGLGGLFSGLGGLFGFANGGSFDIGGRGGVDNNLLSVNNKPIARVSKGERVTVSPNGGGGGRPININFAVTTPDGNMPRQTQEQMAARAASAIRRADRRNN